jgi:ribonuclease D
LSRRELAVLGELFAWRDSVAKDLDRATFRVIGNEQLLELARTQPSTPQSLGQTKGVSRGLLDRRAAEMLDAIRRGLEVPEADLPKFAKAPRWDRDPHFDDRATKVKAARDAMAVELDLDPGVLCARERMEAVARKNPQSPEQLAGITELRRWQADVLGPSFLAALKE